VADLETVDIPAVEVLSTGGPVHGQGSPPEGDFWTRDQLEQMAAAARELAAEIKPPNKIGHSDAQQLVANSALAVPTPGEMPAVGWLDGSTARVVDGDDGVDAVLVMDAKAVPKQFSQLIKAGAYRTRSAELSRITSQVTQKTYDWVVTGLAWLGAKLPAVQTLDDVVALYASRQLEVSDGVRAYVVYAADDGPAPTPTLPQRAVVWDPEQSFQDLRDDVSEALNGAATGGMIEPRFWVADINLAGDRALVQDYYDDGDDGYVVPFAQNADGSITIAPSSDWVQVEQGWVAAAKEFARKNERPAESRPMELTLTDEQEAQIREQLGLDADAEITPEVLLEANEQRANELAERDAKIAELEQRRNQATGLEETVRKLETDLKVEQRARFEMERDQAVLDAIRDGRVDPANRDKWVKRYDASPELTKEILADLPVDETLRRELGREDGDLEALDDEEYQREFERRHGMKAVV
jgi:hypothetical protein